MIRNYRSAGRFAAPSPPYEHTAVWYHMLTLHLVEICWQGSFGVISFDVAVLPFYQAIIYVILDDDVILITTSIVRVTTALCHWILILSNLLLLHIYALSSSLATTMWGTCSDGPLC